MLLILTPSLPAETTMRIFLDTKYWIDSLIEENLLVNVGDRHIKVKFAPPIILPFRL
jgi:hypothetical protein